MIVLATLTTPALEPIPGANDAISRPKLIPRPLATSHPETLGSAISAPIVANELPIPRTPAAAVPYPGA